MSTAPDNIEVLPGRDHPAFGGEHLKSIARSAEVPVSQLKPEFDKPPQILPDQSEESEQPVESSGQQEEAEPSTFIKDVRANIESEVAGVTGIGDNHNVRTTRSKAFQRAKMGWEQKTHPEQNVILEGSK